MAQRSKSSPAWLHEHVNDPYVKRAQKDGYRARAAYKLLEINEKDKLIKQGTVLADLGSAPGSWSQIAAKLVGKTGKVFALDILPMDALDGGHLKTGGAFLVKVFQGSGYQEYMAAMREVFGTVQTRKPDASRNRSSEIYLLGKNKH